MKVSNLSFGASSLGGVFHNVREAEGIKAVHTAVDNGMNFIDVSPYYGHYKAEIVLGKALKDIPRDKYYLSTKVGRYGKDGVNLWDYSAKRAIESVYESMERLHVDYIDLINVHDVEFADMRQVVNITLPALVGLREKGVVGHVGITDLQLENLKWVVDCVPEGTVESVLSFCHHCLNDDRLTEFLDYFESKQVGSLMLPLFRWGCFPNGEYRIGIRPQNVWSRLVRKRWRIVKAKGIPLRNWLYSLLLAIRVLRPLYSVRPTRIMF